MECAAAGAEFNILLATDSYKVGTAGGTEPEGGGHLCGHRSGPASLQAAEARSRAAAGCRSPPARLRPEGPRGGREGESAPGLGAVREDRRWGSAGPCGPGACGAREKVKAARPGGGGYGGTGRPPAAVGTAAAHVRPWGGAVPPAP